MRAGGRSSRHVNIMATSMKETQIFGKFPIIYLLVALWFATGFEIYNLYELKLILNISKHS